MDPQAQPITETGRWLAGEFGSAIGLSVEGMSGERPLIEWSPLDGSAQPEPGIWWKQTLTAGKDTAVWAGCPEQAGEVVGRVALSAAGIEDASTADCLDTWREILGQALSVLSQSMTKRLRREVTCGARTEGAAAPDADYVVRMDVTVGEDSLPMYFAWGKALEAALEPQTSEAKGGEPAGAGGKREPVASESGAAAPRVMPLAIEKSRTLDLLLEVELPVSVSFGRAELPLRDVMKLSSGSIVELNRAINEPVELIVNNCVIARGEVVVVEGNYGVRIKQIISKEERLRTLH